MKAVIARMRDYIERERLQPDLNRAARSTVAFMVPLLAAHSWGLPIEATFAAIAAQNVAQVDVRGSYPLRLSLLLAMAVILAGATWLGGMTGSTLPLALGAITLLMILGGLWRHLNSEYGPPLAIASGLLFLIALSHPSGEAVANRHFLAALCGGLWAVIIQGVLWPFRAQHPMRRAVADSWLALSDLLATLSPSGNPDPTRRHEAITAQQATLRTVLDHTTALLAAAPSRDKHPYVRQLDALNLVAARFATRFMAFNTSLETLMERPDFDALAPSFDPVITSLKNSARAVALTVVSRQPSHLAASEVRLRRLGTLLQALEERVEIQTAQSPEGVQLSFILQQVAGLIPAITEALRATIDRASERSAFSLELFDLQTWTLRPLASSLNLQWRPDPTLVRFIARATALQLIGVAAFKLLDLERGYWLPLTTLVVLQPEYGATRLRAGQRVLGTLAGSVLGSVLLWLAPPPAFLMTAMAITIGGFSFSMKRNYTVAVFFITVFVVLITEISMHVTIAFTLERLASTAAGGVLALLAAQLFWPVWERQRFPALLARALRDNRDYLQLLGQRVAEGGGYDAPVIAAKRSVELANGIVFASLQRMAADPKNQQVRLEDAAETANDNQRLTQALTVLALHLAPGVALPRPELANFTALGAEALEAIATSIESQGSDPARLASLRTAIGQLPLRGSKDPGITPMEHGIYSQFARCATELSAMLISVQPEAGRTAVKATAPGLPSTR